MTAKEKRSKTKEKKRTDFRGVITGYLWIIIVLVVLGLLIWLMLPAAERRGVPRKLRGAPQTSSETYGVWLCAGDVQTDALSVFSKEKGDIPLFMSRPIA
jgi:hypothetical protein